MLGFAFSINSSVVLTNVELLVPSLIQTCAFQVCPFVVFALLITKLVNVPLVVCIL